MWSTTLSDSAARARRQDTARFWNYRLYRKKFKPHEGAVRLNLSVAPKPCSASWRLARSLALWQDWQIDDDFQLYSNACGSTRVVTLSLLALVVEKPPVSSAAPPSIAVPAEQAA